MENEAKFGFKNLFWLAIWSVFIWYDPILFMVFHLSMGVIAIGSTLILQSFVNAELSREYDKLFPELKEKYKPSVEPSFWQALQAKKNIKMMGLYPSLYKSSTKNVLTVSSF